MSAPSNVLPRTSTAAQPLSVQALPLGAGPEEEIELPRERSRRSSIQLLRLAVALAIIGSWELTTRLQLVDPFFYGQPSGIVQQIYKWASSGTAQGPLWLQVAVTLEETVLGFLIGVVLGVIFGILLGRSQALADVFAPYIKAANSIPRVVLGSIFIISLGLGLASKVALAVVLVFFVVFFNAFQGVREVDRNLIANARILGASERRVTLDVIVPSAMSWIIASLHTSFGFALVGAVVGEFLGSTKGLGLLIATAQNSFNANGVFAAMVILAIVALVAEACVTGLENRLIRWRPTPLSDIGL
ncbi:MAG TPA: ABC transporter permease [Chloroflexota bacterium]|nr:ABC transporter permease [Chloroflexota bacterium]